MVGQGEFELGSASPPTRDHTTAEHSSKILIANGPRDAQERLIEAVLALEAQRATDWSALSAPIRIVVPSVSLRRHLSAALVRRAGRSLLGVRLDTLRGVAHQLLKGSETSALQSDFFFPLLCRREVSSEPALCAALEELEDGFGSVVGTLSDLLDAGLEAPLDEAILESLEALSNARGKGKAKSGALARAQELVRVAARMGPALNALGGERTGDVYRRAADRYSENPSANLPASAIFIFGFSDVTGVAGDLLERLASYGNTKIVLDLPPDPAHPEALDAGVVFAERFAQRFGLVESDSQAAPQPPSDLACFQAPGSRAEIEEVASRITTLLEAGAAAEEIGVVIRQVEPYGSDLRAVFSGQGIPYSAPGESGVMASTGRMLSCLRQLLRSRDAVSVESWLSLVVSLADSPKGAELTPARRETLRVAAHEAGAGRLAGLAKVASEGKGRPSFSRSQGLVRQEHEGQVLWQAIRHRPSLEDWKAFLEKAEHSARFWGQWPEQATWTEHCEALQSLLEKELGWAHASVPEIFLEVLERLAVLKKTLPGDWLLTRGEALNAFSQWILILEEEQRTPLGGEGAGVQVLSVTDARSMTFEHLFLLGLNRDQFPRAIREDPLLPDWLRQQITQVLPELPLKLKAADEEKYLFAQLLSAAPHVTLSWQCVDNAGKELACSPLVMRLQIEGVLPEEPELSEAGPVERWLSEGKNQGQGGSAHTALRYAALHGSREDFRELLPLAIQGVHRELGLGLPSPDLAAARLAILEEMDLDRSSTHGRTRFTKAGPYFGFVGNRGDEDPRGNPLYVTTLERYARCPWSSFLEKHLSVATPPDALAAIPVVDGLLLGSMVHKVLEYIAERSFAGESSDASARKEGTLGDLIAAQGEPVPVPWPSEKELEKILKKVSRKAALDMGVPEWEGLLLRRLNPLVQRAKELDWEDGAQSVSCLGVELQDEIVFREKDGSERRLFFRADRVDQALETSALRLVDYKSGKSFLKNTSEAGRRKEMGRAIASGEHLQAIVYALSGEGRTGAYQFLRPDSPKEAANFEVRGDEDYARALRSAVTVLFKGMDQGAYPPRLLDGKGNASKHCEYCSVSQACTKGDSSFRQRLLAVMGELSTSDLDDSPLLENFESLWNLSTGDPEATRITEDRWVELVSSFKEPSV